MLARKRVEDFLRGKGQVLGLVGPPGTGKLFGTRLAAEAVGGFSLTEMDRAQGAVNYSRLGAYVLGADGLTKSLFVVCNADAETEWNWLSRISRGSKFILIANDGQAFKRAKIAVEQVRRPTVAEMTRTLFCDHGMEVTQAQRLAQLADGDWRALRTLETYFAQAAVASMDAGDFELAVESTAKDKPRAEAMHPSFAAHILFSGQAEKHCGGLEGLADYGVLAWGERNLGVACETIEDMARMQEAACLADTMVVGGAAELGLDHFARSAALKPRTALRYDYRAYSAPDRNGKEADESIRKSWERRAPSTRREKGRLTLNQQEPDNAKPAKVARKRGAPAGTAKSVPKRKTAASKR